MARVLLLLVAFAACAGAQQTKPQEPVEEDESLAPKEYTFNPLQSEKELKVGNFYYRKGKYKAAATRFEEAGKWNPNSPEAWLRLAQTEEKLKDEVAARRAYQKYLEVAPDAKNKGAIEKKLARH